VILERSLHWGICLLYSILDDETRLYRNWFEHRRQAKNCVEAVERLEQIRGCSFIGCSRWYLTSPVGVENQDWFVNGVASLDAGISAQDLLDGLLRIEAAMGRVRTEKWGPGSSIWISYCTGQTS